MVDNILAVVSTIGVITILLLIWNIIRKSKNKNNNTDYNEYHQNNNKQKSNNTQPQRNIQQNQPNRRPNQGKVQSNLHYESKPVVNNNNTQHNPNINRNNKPNAAMPQHINVNNNINMENRNMEQPKQSKYDNLLIPKPDITEDETDMNENTQEGVEIIRQLESLDDLYSEANLNNEDLDWLKNSNIN